MVGCTYKIAPAAAIALTFTVYNAVASEATTYTYDALGRVAAAASSGSVNDGLNLSYTYDPAGNRLTYTVSGSANNGAPERIVVVVPLAGFKVIPINQ